ncbi:glycosyltransferase family 2 protein [Patescibacteria group bacterium]
MKKPIVTVLMPVYNGEEYLKEAIDGVLNQTFTDFEFFILNDGSTDNGENIIKSYTDPRIKLINSDKNRGQAEIINEALDIVQSKYVVRVDCDDICLPKRLQTQVDFMDKNPEIGISGTWAKVMGKQTKKYIKPPSDFEKIKVTMLFNTAMMQPSTIMRREMLDKYNLRYDKTFKYSGDYEFWTRAIQYFPITNIKKVLFLYRMHEKSVSNLYSDIQKQNSLKNKLNQLKKINVIPSEEELIIHQNIYKPIEYKIDDFLNQTETWLVKLINQNKKIKYCEELQFSEIISKRWLKVCNINANYNLKIFKRFWDSILRKKLNWFDLGNWKNLTRFFLKCLFKKTIAE